MTYDVFLIRITMSFVYSLIIGLERQLRGRAIGLRTNVLVSIGAFLFVSFSFLTSSGDVGRIAAQVVSGIGFLGAGVIIKDGANIRGLNTAATLWCAAAIGVLCASGHLLEAGIGTMLMLFANVVLRFLTMKISKNNSKKQIYDFNILCKKGNEQNIKNLIIKLVSHEEINLTNINSKEEGENISISVSLVSDNNFNYLVDKLLSKLTSDSAVLSLGINRTELKKENGLDDDE